MHIRSMLVTLGLLGIGYYLGINSTLAIPKSFATTPIQTTLTEYKQPEAMSENTEFQNLVKRLNQLPQSKGKR